MNAMLSDEELTQLLDEAAGSFAVPELELDIPVVVTKQVWQRRWPQAGAAAAVLVTAGLLLSSVGGPGGSDADTAGFRGSLAPNDFQYSQSGGTTGGTSGGADLGAAAPPVAGELTPTGAKSTAGVVDGADSARVVKSGSLSLVVDEGKVSATVQRLQVLVAAARGYVADSQSSEAGDHPTATLTVRVPAASFERVLDQVRALKVKVVSTTTSGKDVTASYADTQAKIQSLKAARSRYLTILSGAKTIAETLTVQQRVDEVQQQIDQLEGQRRVLADQSDFGTLTFTVAETTDEVFITKEPSGWSKAWKDAKHGFSSGVQSLIAHSGRTLLVLLVAAALLLLGRSGWRLARRRLVSGLPL